MDTVNDRQSSYAYTLTWRVKTHLYDDVRTLTIRDISIGLDEVKAKLGIQRRAEGMGTLFVRRALNITMGGNIWIAKLLWKPSNIHTA